MPQMCRRALSTSPPIA